MWFRVVQIQSKRFHIVKISCWNGKSIHPSVSLSFSENYISETKEFDMKGDLTVISEANCLSFPNLRPTPTKKEKRKKKNQKYILTPSPLWKKSEKSSSNPKSCRAICTNCYPYLWKVKYNIFALISCTFENCTLSFWQRNGYDSTVKLFAVWSCGCFYFSLFTFFLAPYHHCRLPLQSPPLKIYFDKYFAGWKFSSQHINQHVTLLLFISARVDGPRITSRRAVKWKVRRLQFWCDFMGACDYATTVEWTWSSTGIFSRPMLFTLPNVLSTCIGHSKTWVSRFVQLEWWKSPSKQV